MTSIFRPPGFVEWLIVAVVGREGWYVLGDLREEYEGLRRDRSRFRATMWFVGQLLRVGPRLAFRRLVPSNMRVDTAAWGPSDWSAPGWLDARQAVRSATRRPGFVALVASTLGVGIAAITLLTAIIQVVLLSPLPFPESERVVSVETQISGLSWFGSSAPEFLDQREIPSFKRTAGYGFGVVTIGDSVAPVRESVTFATADLLPLLGRAPLLGRYFATDEDVPGGPRTIVLSHALWQRDFGGREDAIGSITLVGGEPTTIVGVMPADFAFPTRETAAWLPWRLDLLDQPAGRANHFLNVVSRLRDGASLETARAELAALTTRSVELYPEHYTSGYRTRVRPFIDRVVGNARTPLGLLLVAATLLFCIATANIATLLIGRAHARAPDLRVRRALGASRVRANAPFVVEAWLGLMLGETAGMLVAWFAVRALAASQISALPRIDMLGMTPGAWAIGGALVAAAGLIASLAPLSVSGRDGETVGRSGRGAVGSRRVRRSQRVLMTGQIALATTLCMGAGLMVRTVGALGAVDHGVAPDAVLTMRISPPSFANNDPDRRVEFYDRLLAGVREVPGVEAAGSALNLPYDGRYGNQWTFQRVEDATKGVGDSPVATVQFVSDGYVSAAGLRLVAGRDVLPSDDADAPAIVLVNETMARRFWPGENPLGQRMRVWTTGDPRPWMEVVGVVADVHANGLGEPAPPIYYLPASQSHVSTFMTPLERVLLVRTAGDPLGLAPAIRRAVTDLGPGTAISNIRPFSDVVAGVVEQQTVTLRVLAVLAAAALILAAVGIAATMTASVRTRRGEIGVRRALGETSRSAALGVVLDALRYVGLGATLGVAASLAGASVIGALIYGVRPWDPATILGVGAVLVVAALGATALPALSAARTDPIDTIRAD